MVLYGYPQETSGILSRGIFLFGLQKEEFLAKCLSEASIEWTAIRIWEMAKMLESSRATAKHMKHQPARQPQAEVNQFRYQRLLPKHRGQEEEAAI